MYMHYIYVYVYEHEHEHEQEQEQERQDIIVHDITEQDKLCILGRIPCMPLSLSSYFPMWFLCTRLFSLLPFLLFRPFTFVGFMV